MKRSLVIPAAMLFIVVCACHGDPNSRDAYLSLGEATFSELIINYGAAVVPEWCEEEIAVNAKPEMVRVVTRSSFDEVSGRRITDTICVGVVPLKADEFAAIEGLMAKIDLATYAPPEDCDVLFGTTGMTVTYRLSNGVANVFHTFCELPAAILDLAAGMREIAGAAIPDCSPDQVTVPVLTE